MDILADVTVVMVMLMVITICSGALIMIAVTGLLWFRDYRDNRK